MPSRPEARSAIDTGSGTGDAVKVASSGAKSAIGVWVGLSKNPDRALAIGRAGRDLALSMTYEAEMSLAADQIATATANGGTLPSKRSSIAARIMDQLYGNDIYKDFCIEMDEDLQGWNSRHPAIRAIFEQAKPVVVMDVGVWKGGSTVFFAELLRDLHIDGVVIAIDTFLGSPEHWIPGDPASGLFRSEHGRPNLYQQFITNVLRREHHYRVVPLPQTSTNAAIILNRLGIRADLIHIDAAHNCEAVLEDARAYWKLLNPGGYLIGDDYHPSWPGVEKGAQEFAREVGEHITVVTPKWIMRKPL
jgi:cephalosporin hydroxylase